MRPYLPQNNIYFVTSQCFQQRRLFKPTRETTEILGFWLGRALERYPGIELYGFNYLSNRFFLLLRDTASQLAEFMWFLKLNTSKALNALRGRKGTSFHSIYDASPVLTDDALVQRYGAVLTMAVAQGQVAKAGDAPFFSSLGASLYGEKLRFELPDLTERHNKTRRNQPIDEEQFNREVEIELSVLPSFTALSEVQRRQKTAELVKREEKKYKAQRKKSGTGVLGVHRIMAQPPLSRPAKWEEQRIESVYCTESALEKSYHVAVGEMMARYQKVYRAFVECPSARHISCFAWPAGSYPPSLMKPVGVIG